MRSFRYEAVGFDSGRRLGYVWVANQVEAKSLARAQFGIQLAYVVRVR